MKTTRPTYDLKRELMKLSPQKSTLPSFFRLGTLITYILLLLGIFLWIFVWVETELHKTIEVIFAQNPQASYAISGVKRFSTILISLPFIPFAVMSASLPITYKGTWLQIAKQILSRSLKSFLKAFFLCCDVYVAIAIRLLPLLFVFILFGLLYRDLNSLWILLSLGLFVTLVFKRLPHKLLVLALTPLIGTFQNVTFKAAQRVTENWFLKNRTFAISLLFFTVLFSLVSIYTIQRFTPLPLARVILTEVIGITFPLWFLAVAVKKRSEPSNSL